MQRCMKSNKLNYPLTSIVMMSFSRVTSSVDWLKCSKVVNYILESCTISVIAIVMHGTFPGIIDLTVSNRSNQNIV